MKKYRLYSSDIIDFFNHFYHSTNKFKYKEKGSFMFVLTNPNNKHFKKLEKILHTKECIVCNNKLKDTGVYFSDDKYLDRKRSIYYSLGCKSCYAVYSSDFQLISMDYTRTGFFA